MPNLQLPDSYHEDPKRHTEIAIEKIIQIIRVLNASLTGSDALSSGTVAVSFAADLPDANYNILLTGDANETFYYSSKTVSGFTINSSNGSSTANVDWKIWI